MPSVRLTPIEKLRRLWSPGSEVEEIVADLGPGTELDSMIRDWLHRVCEQNGPQTVVLGEGADFRPNTGTLRFEMVHFAPSPGLVGRRELTVWVEDPHPDPPLIPQALAAIYPDAGRVAG